MPSMAGIIGETIFIREVHHSVLMENVEISIVYVLINNRLLLIDFAYGRLYIDKI